MEKNIKKSGGKGEKKPDARTGKTRPAMPGAGRKPKTFDWPEVGRMCHIQCTHDEIANILGTTKETLYFACQRDLKIDFPTFYTQKASGGKKCLRRRQWSEAIDEGNTTMLIWLGKQNLGQSDKIEASGKGNGPLVGVLNVFFGGEASDGENPEG